MGTTLRVAGGWVRDKLIGQQESSHQRKLTKVGRLDREKRWRARSRGWPRSSPADWAHENAWPSADHGARPAAAAASPSAILTSVERRERYPRGHLKRWGGGRGLGCGEERKWT